MEEAEAEAEVEAEAETEWMHGMGIIVHSCIQTEAYRQPARMLGIHHRKWPG